MIQTTLRPLTAAERAELIDRVTVLFKTSRGAAPGTFAYIALHTFQAFIVGCALAFFLLLLSKSVLWAGALIALCTVVGFLAYSGDAPATLSPVESVLENLRRDEVEETTVIAYSVAEVYFEDEHVPTGYFFDIGDDSVLFLWDEHFSLVDDGDNERVALPSVFTLTQVSGEEEVLNLIPAGPNLTVSRILQFIDEDTMLNLTDASVLSDVSLETIEHDLPELVCALSTEQA